jgi:hypothetical protein
VVQVSGVASCGTVIGGEPCLKPENAPLDEKFRLQLCYAPSAPGVPDADAGISVPGALPSGSIECVHREFRIVDGVAEISPVRGPSCESHADCTRPDELCFSGACTSSCPAHDAPEIGGAWQVRVAEPDDQGFFSVTSNNGSDVYTGQGTASSVVYQSGTLIIRLTRPGTGGEALTGALYVSIPQAVLPLASGDVVSVKLIDNSSDENYDNRAVVVRDADGGLLLAADAAQQGLLLTDGEVAPFSVRSGETVVACQHDDCGKRLYRETVFQVEVNR